MATVPELRAAGFSDDEIAAWAGQKRAELDAAGFDAHEIDNHLTGVEMPREVSEPFLRRFMDERMAAVQRVGKDIELGFGHEPLGFSEPNVKILRDIGIFPQPGQISPLRFANEALIRPTATAIDAVMRGVNAGIVGIGSAISESAALLGAETPERIKRDVIALANVVGIATGGMPHPVTRPRVTQTGQLIDQPVGSIPRQMDFVDAGDVLRTPQRQKLVELYTEKGVHPSEVVDDARTDPTVKQDMMSVNPGLPERYAGKYEEPEILPPGPTRTEIAAEQLYTEPDHLDPTRSVAKDATGKVVGEGATPEAALADAAGGAGGKGPPGALPPIIEDEAGPPLTPGPPGASVAKAAPSLEDATATMLDHMSIGEAEPRRGWSFSRLYTNFLDALNPIKRLEREFVPEGVPAQESPYAAYRMLTGSVTQSHDMIMGAGVPDFAALYKPGARPGDVATVARPLSKILEPVSAAQELDKFRAFAAAARTLELERRGIATGFDLEAARVVARGYADQFAPVLAELIDFQNKVSASLVESGIISREARAGMLSQNLLYTPFYRVLEEEVGPTGRAGRSLQPTNPIERIKGSEREVIDPIESIIKNTYLYNQKANQNLAARSLADFMERIGLSPKTEVGAIPTTAPAGAADLAAWLERNGTPKATADELAVFVQTVMISGEDLGANLRVFRNGKETLYPVDPEIARAVQGLDRTTASTLVKILGQWTSVLRVGALLVPEFGVRHLIRDYFYALVTSPGGFSPLNMVRGVMHGIKGDQMYQDWVRSGAANVTMMAFDRRWLQEDLHKLGQDTGLFTRAWNVVASPEMSVGQKAGLAMRSMIHPFQVWMEVALSATHLGAFEKAIGRGASLREAAFEARETSVDVAKMGAKMQAYNSISAFANATVQDTARWVAELDPRDPKKAAGAAFKIAAGITTPSVLLWALNHDDADWKEIPQWQKDIFWLIPVGNAAPSEAQIAQAEARGEPPQNSAAVWLRVPKPFGLGVIFGSGPERTLDALYAHEPGAFKGFLDSMMGTTLPAIVPSPAVPIMEQWANKSMFTGRPLIPKSLEGQLPEYQYTNYTTETSQLLGHLLGGATEGGVSPIRIESLIRGWTGQSGIYALNIVDYGLRKAGLVNDPPQPASQLADIPFVRAFVVRYPAASTRSIEDFHEEFDRRSKLFTTFQAQAQAGNVAALQQITEMGGPATFARLQGINHALTQMGRVVQGVWKNPEIPGAEKRQLIDKIYGDMSVIARAGNSAFRATAKVPR